MNPQKVLKGALKGCDDSVLKIKTDQIFKGSGNVYFDNKEKPLSCQYIKICLIDLYTVKAQTDRAPRLLSCGDAVIFGNFTLLRNDAKKVWRLVRNHGWQSHSFRLEMIESVKIREDEEQLKIKITNCYCYALYPISFQYTRFYFETLHPDSIIIDDCPYTSHNWRLS